MGFLCDRFFTKVGTPRNINKASSISSGIHEHIECINDSSFWLIRKYSNVSFWTYNWLGYRISERLAILTHILRHLTCSISNYFIDEVWHFTSHFITHHLEVVLDILQTPIHDEDQYIWPSSGTRSLTSKHAYDLLHSQLLSMS